MRVAIHIGASMEQLGSFAIHAEPGGHEGAAGQTRSFAGMSDAERSHLGEIGEIDSHKPLLSSSIISAGLGQWAPVRPRGECLEGGRRGEYLTIRQVASDKLHPDGQAVWSEAGRYGDCRETGVAGRLGEPME